MLVAQIEEIIRRVGPRPAGSAAELAAQQVLQARLLHSTDAVQVEAFEAPLTAKFTKMKWCGLLFMIGLALYWFSPIAAMVLGWLNAVVVVADLMRNDGVADFLFKKHTSWNLSATLEPQDEVRQTILITGHIDSTHECQWWYRWKQWGIQCTVMNGVLIVLWPLFLVWFLLAEKYAPGSLFLANGVYLMFLLLSPAMVVYLSFHNDTVVPGACDNLSGIVIALNVFEQLRDKSKPGFSMLPHTRIRFVSFGAEERGLRGSSAYVRKHTTALQSENVFVVNVDSVRLEEKVCLLTGEWMSGAFYDKKMTEQIQDAFKTQGYPCEKAPLPFGATDAVPFARQGFRAVSIIGIDMKKLDETYHTRLDQPERLSEKALQNVVDALVLWARKL
ncbi:MAG: M20/M25/M40 family metallo-hydrolase [Chitinophagales bacterium]